LLVGLAAMFFEEVKRSAASHDEKNHRRSPRDPTTLLPKRQYGICLDVDTFR
jgi:hypothetical protein